MARRAAPAVKVIETLRAMNPDVRQTVLDMARAEFRPVIPASKVARKVRAPKMAFVQADPQT